MKDYIDGHQVANTVRMLASRHKGAFMLVEGSTDRNLFEGFVDQSSCMVVVGYNKSNVLHAMSHLSRDRRQDVVAIVDSDYWDPVPAPDRQYCVFCTDSHDIETMMLESEALDKILRELADEKKLSAFQASRKAGIRDVLVREGMRIGVARKLSFDRHDRLKFRELDFSRFVEAASLSVAIDLLATEIVKNTPGCSISPEELAKKIELLQMDDLPSWRICQGHDLVKLLSIALQDAIGDRSPGAVAPPVLERYLRLAFEYSHFRKTRLWNALDAWQQANPKYRIFRMELHATT